MDKKEMKAVILAGGFGTRLRPHTLFIPKSMLPLGDKPVIEHIIEWLKSQGITEIVISVGYLRKIIENYFHNGRDFDVNISYVRTNNPMGTAGQLKVSEKVIDNTFLCIYGDMIPKFDLKDSIRLHKSRKATVTMTLIQYKTTMKYGFIETNKQNKIVSWNEKPEYEGKINLGCYIMEPKFFEYIPRNRICEMDEAFMNAVNARESIYGISVKGNFLDIGDKESYSTAYSKYISNRDKVV